MPVPAFQMCMVWSAGATPTTAAGLSELVSVPIAPGAVMVSVIGMVRGVLVAPGDVMTIWAW